ncbi:MAG TPA: PAS domain-containing protein, partial [Deltaproteobacteria bacterium]|nr:PAS domain-containing protein [Deltaproteobacteria bacterium]
MEISGYEPADFYQNPLLIQKVIHHDWTDYFVREFENIFKGAMSPAYEFKIVHKSGQERWVHQRNVMVKDDEGRPLAIEGIVTDITARKQAERAFAGVDVLGPCLVP